MAVETNTSSSSDATHSAARNFSQSAGCSMEQIFTPISITKNAVSPTPGFRPPLNRFNEYGFFGLRYNKLSPSSGAEELSYEEQMAQRREDYQADLKKRADDYKAEMERRKKFYQDANNPPPTPEEIIPPEPESDGPSFRGSVGPTINELNPYFPSIFGDDGSAFITWNDYNVVVHEPTSDLNLKKNSQRAETRTIRTQALRGPLILSGWGFDVSDMPVPNLGARVPGRDYEFDPLMVNQRSYWKTGPVHLMWDDERQVWSGGYQILCGHLSDDPEDKDSREDIWRIEAPRDPMQPTTFNVKVLRRQSYPGFTVPYTLLTSDLKEKISCVNRDVDLSWAGEDPKNVFIVAIRINYEWIPVYVRAQKPSIFIGDFDGEWKKGRGKDVTQSVPRAGDLANPVIVNVLNLFADVSPPSGNGKCAYVKIDNTYYLLAAEC